MRFHFLPLARNAVALALLVCVPRFWMTSDSREIYRDPKRLRSMSTHLAEEVLDGIRDPRNLGTGSEFFNDEWVYGSLQMGVLALVQTQAPQEEVQKLLVPLLDTRSHRFGAQEWSDRDGDDYAGLEEKGGHGYLGYLGVSLGMARLFGYTTIEQNQLHDRLIAGLRHAYGAAGNDGLIATYPGQAFPCDAASVLGSIALHARIHRDVNQQENVRVKAQRLVQRFLRLPNSDSPSYAYLQQQVDPSNGSPLEARRGSGTALAAFFLSFADRGSALIASQVLINRGYFQVLGFGAIREYEAGEAGEGDIDSGPIIFGASISASGMALAAARIAHREDLFVGLSRSANLFGAKVGNRYALGGPLGNVFLLALMSAGPGADGLASNALASNALASNALASNALASNALASNALASNAETNP